MIPREIVALIVTVVCIPTATGIAIRLSAPHIRQGKMMLRLLLVAIGVIVWKMLAILVSGI